MIDTSPNLVLVVVIGVLVGTGVYLLLERSLSRVLIGVALLGNGVNLLMLVAGGAAGGPPLIGSGPPEEMSDPLPQAMVLTAIVITLGFTAFLLAMAHRSWQLHGHDEVQDDFEDRRVARRAEQGEVDRRTDDDDVNADLEAARVRDETEEIPIAAQLTSPKDAGGLTGEGTGDAAPSSVETLAPESAAPAAGGPAEPSSDDPSLADPSNEGYTPPITPDDPASPDGSEPEGRAT